MHISTKNKLKFFGLKNYCPVCKSFISRFKPIGFIQKRNALCPVCHSLERHRLVWLFFKNEMNLFLFDKKIKMLHTAPENCFVRRLKNAENIDYYSIDIQSELADDKMSLIDLQFADETFDFFYSSHVLEHIENDKKAFKEIFRVLKPNGVAIIIVPIKGEKTEEDLSVKSPELREKIYGQSDHVRIYGTDIEYRIKEEGFNVEMIKYYYTFSKFKQKYLGLSNEIIIKCVK